ERPAPSVARPPGPALPPAPALMPARPVALQPSWALGAAAGAVAFLVLALLGWGVRALRAATRSIGRRLGESTKGAAPRGSCEVRRLSIALDWTARARIQRGLEQLAGRHDLSTARGMHAAAAAAADLLRASLGAVRYACWQRLPVSSSQAEGRFRSLVADLKSRFRVDVVRGDRAPGSLRARADEGEGLVVVSLVLGATAPLPALPGRLGPATLAQALGQLHTVAPRDLVALEVVWSPALERDRMSSLELERLYPELLRLGAGVGATACHYCQAVHAAELPRCPACGAPTRPAAPAAPSPRRA
ncbi:MAG TPA: DUF1517 domain-containing protein, partial [Polyangiaceae bacterium LLY-WYZ-15_(1-7)]|nr:DUF1517 domain-containing protein [Polyangiaceae bacterium LLY-WYZ-15_(1-7)]